MKTLKNKWCIVVNPNSGRGKAKKDLPIIESLLTKHGIDYEIKISEHQGHSVKLTRDAIKSGYRNFVSVGGDGTMNEVVNGIFSDDKLDTRQCKLAVIPVGTGNDWARNNGFTLNYAGSIEMIARDKPYLHDVGKVKFENGKHERYFLNIAGFGFDSVILENLVSRKFGKLAYLISTVKTFFSYSSTPAEVVIDGKKYKLDIFLIIACLGKYAGGGMQLAPNALPDDGCFDLTIIKKLSRLDLVLSLPKIYNGTILKHPRVESYRCKTIELNSEAKIKVYTDGETLELPPATYKIKKQSLNVIGTFNNNS